MNAFMSTLLFILYIISFDYYLNYRFDKYDFSFNYFDKFFSSFFRLITNLLIKNIVLSK